MKTHIEAHTDGKGLWTEESRLVIIDRVEIGYSSLEYYPEDEFHGELRAYFDATGLTVGGWNVAAYGLIYTDAKWLREFKRGLRALGLSERACRNVSYSEQGMQGKDYVSMDIGAHFYTSWKRLA